MLLSCVQVVQRIEVQLYRIIVNFTINCSPRRRSIYFYIFGVSSLNDVQMSSKVNNKIPHTRVNSIRTSLHSLKWQSSVTRHCLLRHFGSGRRNTGSRIETRARIGINNLSANSSLIIGCNPFNQNSILQFITYHRFLKVI